MRRNTYKRREKGLVKPDPFLSYIKGYDRLQKSAIDGMDLHGEVESIQHGIFPFREVSVTERPGSKHLTQHYFGLDHENQKIKKDLEEYFTEEYSRSRDGLYGHLDSLGSFLQGVAHQLIVVGESFETITWDEVDINGAKYQLPVDFGYIRSETVNPIVDDGKIVRYTQRYSLFTYLIEKKFKDYDGNPQPRVYEFQTDEIFHCCYPFFKKTPVARSIKYLRYIKRFWRFGLAQAQGGAEPWNRDILIEKARFTTFGKEKRKHDIARAKIRTIFNCLLDANGPKMTEYYDIYTVIRYKKYLNNFRNYLIKEFNEQIMVAVAQKNGFSSAPIIKVNGFYSNEELDSSLKAYADGSMSYDQIRNYLVGLS